MRQVNAGHLMTQRKDSAIFGRAAGLFSRLAGAFSFLPSSAGLLHSGAVSLHPILRRLLRR